MDSPIKQINEFKDDLRSVIGVFLKLVDMYEHDNDNISKALPAFRKYLEDFNLRYQGIEIIVEYDDFTKDDLKILLNNYESKDEIITKFKVNFPIVAKNNLKYGKLQFFVDYTHLKDGINYNIDLLAGLAMEKGVSKEKLKMPVELELISLEIGENFSNADQGMANK
ncbi:hypothetical protein H6503_01195 [Candidatus Woesearchaeota archaeon]|nr:hypothetical protein [Candidatus Woesearchaeota archaeon]